MASPNLDLARSILADWERGEFDSADWADPAIESAIADGPAPARYRGLAGMAQGFREVLTAWEGFRYQAEEYRELDDDRVLVLTRFAGRGRTSGVDLAQTAPRGAVLFQMRDRRVTRAVFYFDAERALADVAAQPDAG